MRIGLVDVDGRRFPNFALMKISAWHKAQGDEVEMVSPLYWDYDLVYQSKIFTFSPEPRRPFQCEVIKGGTGYDLHRSLPDEIDRLQPDYSLYPHIDHKTAYGFLTRGCPNRCPWCVVPVKEGGIRPYMDVEEIATDGRTNLILMDNNILAPMKGEHGITQIEKIVRLGYRVDFNQALDARFVTPTIARLLSKVRWLGYIRFGCDTPAQIADCERAMHLIDTCTSPRQYLLYTRIGHDMEEAYKRLTWFRGNPRVRIVAQPYRDFTDPDQEIPRWQKDMAHWAMRRQLYATCDFKDFSPRKGFTCKEYFNNKITDYEKNHF